MHECARFQTLARPDPRSDHPHVLGAGDAFGKNKPPALVRPLSDHLVDALFTPVEQHTIRRILTRSPAFDVGDSGGAIESKTTQDELATMVRVPRQTVQRGAGDPHRQRVHQLAVGTGDPP